MNLLKISGPVASYLQTCVKKDLSEFLFCEIVCRKRPVSGSNNRHFPSRSVITERWRFLPSRLRTLLLRVIRLTGSSYFSSQVVPFLSLTSPFFFLLKINTHWEEPVVQEGWTRMKWNEVRVIGRGKQYPPHDHDPHDQMHSGPLVSCVSNQVYRLILCDH